MTACLQRLALCASVALVLPGAALAVDGTKLIDQARALAGGLTPGDGPGFPVLISQPGSYRLSGNLTVPDAGTTAIEITADNVTLDLNGFSIQGPTVCSGIPTSCAPAGTGIGVLGRANYIAVRNGIVRGMGADGVQLTERIGSAGRSLGHQVSDLQVNGNGGYGISIGTGIVRNSVVRVNGGRGISVDSGLVTGNLVSQNVEAGVRIAGTGAVLDNTISDNGSCGASVNSGLVRGNNLLQNDPGLCLGAAGYLGNTLIGNNPSGGLNLGQNLCGSTVSGLSLCP